MITTTFRIPYKYGDTIKIKNLADIHRGNKYCDVRAFRNYLADSDEHTYFLSTGDLLDSVTTQDWRYEKHSDATQGDTIVDEQIDLMEEDLFEYKDRLLGLGRGNHEKTIIKRCNTDPIKRLCKRLDCQYLGYSWLVRVVLSDNGGRGRSILIYGHHGFGAGSRTEGADLTKYWRHASHWDADIYLYGHTHQLKIDHRDRLGMAGNKLVAKNQYLAVCGTFLKTFAQSQESTYSEEAGYNPISVGGITIHLQPTDRWIKIWLSK